MANFNEHALEMSIMELFKDEGYIHLNGSQIHRERTEILLREDLKQYLYNRYAKDGITPSEVDGILLMLRNISGTLYEANKAFYKLLCDGFILNREDRTQKDIYIELIDFDTPENNIFKAVNQFEIEGINNQLRIPDGIVFVNGTLSLLSWRVSLFSVLSGIVTVSSASNAISLVSRGESVGFALSCCVLCATVCGLSAVFTAFFSCSSFIKSTHTVAFGSIFTFSLHSAKLTCAL